MRMVQGFVIVLIATHALAIVRRHDRDDSRYLDLGKGQSAVVDLNLPGGAGTLIAPAWVLTAAHAAKLMKNPHQVRIAGTLRDVRRTIVYPGGGEGKDDIALVQLADAVKDVEPIPVYAGRDEGSGDKTVTFIGQGFTGDGMTGPTARDGQRRGATNQIEAIKQNWLTFVFDAPPAGTDLEGISGPGDSGGPGLMTIGGHTFVVGVSSGQDSRATGREGTYGVTEFYVRVSSYSDWIRSSMASAVDEPRPPASH